jgi:hypothetical protein
MSLVPEPNFRVVLVWRLDEGGTAAGSARDGTATAEATTKPTVPGLWIPRKFAAGTALTN